MSTLAEIEDAAEKLAPAEQEELISFLTEHLRRLDAWEKVPVRPILGIASDREGETNIAANYKDYLYGDGRPG